MAKLDNTRKRSREEYYYAPIPIEIMKFMDDLVAKEGRKYGFDSRPKILGAVLGSFVELYEKVGTDRGLSTVMEMIRHADRYTKKKDNCSSSSSSSSLSPSIKIL